MQTSRGRAVTLVSCTQERVLGALAPFPVTEQYWRHTEDVVAACRAFYGIDVIVLRLLQVVRSGAADFTPSGNPPLEGGRISYLAQVDFPTSPRSIANRISRWQRGPAGTCSPSIRCALNSPDRVARKPMSRGPRGCWPTWRWPKTATPVQVRTWNLSSIWRLPTTEGQAWLKVVPPFFAHEGELLSRFDPAVVPAVLGFDGPRVLLADVPGVDQYGATGEPLVEVIRSLVGLQRDWADRLPELVAIGVPDHRAEKLVPLVADAFERHADELDRDARRRLRVLIGSLSERMAAAQAAGLSDSLVHGDFHRGNVSRGQRTIHHARLGRRGHRIPGLRSAPVAQWSVRSGSIGGGYRLVGALAAGDPRLRP